MGTSFIMLFTWLAWMAGVDVQKQELVIARPSAQQTDGGKHHPTYISNGF